MEEPVQPLRRAPEGGRFELTFVRVTCCVCVVCDGMTALLVANVLYPAGLRDFFCVWLISVFVPSALERHDP